MSWPGIGTPPCFTSISRKTTDLRPPTWPVCRDRPLAGFCTKVSPQDLRPLYKKKLGICLRVALCDVGDWKEVGWMGCWGLLGWLLIIDIVMIHGSFPKILTVKRTSKCLVSLWGWKHQNITRGRFIVETSQMMNSLVLVRWLGELFPTNGGLVRWENLL